MNRETLRYNCMIGLLGRSNAGKSSLLGHLLHQQKLINDRLIDDLKTKAKENFTYALVPMRFRYEREIGHSVQLNFHLADDSELGNITLLMFLVMKNICIIS